MRIKTANGKTKVVFTKAEYLRIGQEKGWITAAHKPTKEELEAHQRADVRNIRPTPAGAVRQVGLGQPMAPAMPAARPAPIVTAPTVPAPSTTPPMTGPAGAAVGQAKQQAAATNPLATAPPVTPNPEQSLPVNQVVSMFNAAKNINFAELANNPDKRDAATVVSLAQSMMDWAQKAVQLLGNG